MTQKLTRRGTVRSRLVGLIVGVGLIVAACSGGSVDGTWHVGEMLQPDGSMAPSDPVVVLTLIIDGDSITGNTGCNIFTGEGRWPGNDLNFTMTTRSCANNSLMQQETLYVRNLLVAVKASVSGNIMTATDTDGTHVLVFFRVSSQSRGTISPIRLRN
jgi:heat shock protein HslJ